MAKELKKVTKKAKTTKPAKTSKAAKVAKTSKKVKATKVAKAAKVTKSTKKELSAKDRKKVTGGNKNIAMSLKPFLLGKKIGDKYKYLQWQYAPDKLEKELASEGYTKKEIEGIIWAMQKERPVNN